MTTNGIEQKIWNFCHTLRDDGVGYGITCLLFLEMVQNTVCRPLTDTTIPEQYNQEN